MESDRPKFKEEKTLFSLRFECPALVIVLMTIFAMMLIAGSAVLIWFYFWLIFPFAVALLVLLYIVFFIAYAVSLKKRTCVITSERIYGEQSFLSHKRKYSYRLDVIDDVQYKSNLGIKSIIIQYSQGHINSYKKYNKTFKISFVADAEETYKNFCDLLTSIKDKKEI